MFARVFLSIATYFIVLLSIAQEVAFDKDNFQDKKSEFKIAQNQIYDADALVAKEKIYQALELYLKANDFNSNSSELNYKIGKCYLDSYKKYRCLEYFEKAYRLRRDVATDIHFLLARGYHLNGRFEEAQNEYQAYYNVLTPKEAVKEKAYIDKYIEECRYGKELIANPARAFVDNLGEPINSQYHDHSPLISADESMLVYTSTRKNGRSADSDGQYDEDIYIAVKQSKTWSKPLPMSEPVNTQFNDATVGLSPDGQNLLIFNGNRGNGDIEECLLDGDNWNYPKAFPKAVNSDSRETSACYSSDGRTLYFVSDRSGGFGGSDIYMSRKNRNGKWEEAVNLGSAINSQYNEETVFIHPDGRTLYFSSEGHSSMGGFDIFVSAMDENGKWSLPVNLGYPVNSPDDDLCFVLSANGRHGYCSSLRAGGKGGYDIYKMTFLGAEKPVVLTNEDNLIAIRTNPSPNIVMEESVAIKTIRLTIVKGLVTDAFTNEVVSAVIEIVDNEKNEVIFTSNTNSATGRFLVSLPSGKNYGLAVKAEGYLFHSENFNIPATNEYQELDKEIKLNNIKKDAKIVLKNVFFETGSANLMPTSYAELGRLSKLLDDYPELKIEISGHTDNKGNYAANKKLSQNRAKAVVDFLISLGVTADRLTYVGNSFDFPISTNDTEEGRQLNRRVEFKVL